MKKRILLVLVAFVILLVLLFHAAQRVVSNGNEPEKNDSGMAMPKSVRGGVMQSASPESSGQTTGGKTAQVREYYTCPMHPFVHKDKPGACPICGMTLVKKIVEADTGATESHAEKSVVISQSRQVLANVATTAAARMPLDYDIRTAGTIDYAESNLKAISIRYPARIEKLYLTYTGQRVEKGDPVADVYSPEAISAQKEYLLALESYEQVRDEAVAISDDARNLLGHARDKLRLWGFTDGQISYLDSTRKVEEIIPLYSPVGGIIIQKNVQPQQYHQAGDDLYDIAEFSTVWLYADIYEYEIQSVKVGQSVSATCDAYPGTTFRGKISFVEPFVDPLSRSVRVRVDLNNPGRELKADMFMTVYLRVEVPSSIVVPAGAVVSTGDHDYVWVKKNQVLFEARQVITGVRTEKFIQILRGLGEHEIVASSGGYLLDSETRMESSDVSVAEDEMRKEMQ